MAMLLIHRNSVVSVDRLAEAVFAGEPTPAASTTLRSYVARLRRVVDATATVTSARRKRFTEIEPRHAVARLHARGSRRRLRRRPVRGIAREGTRRARPRRRRDGGLGPARRRSRSWHGEPYAEFADEDWARAEAQRLHELRLVAERATRRRRTRVRARRGDGLRARALVAEHPFRDGFRERFMLALYRAGRQADALRAYQDHRAVLAEELGLDPSPALVELERRILEHDPALHLDRTGRPSAPRVPAAENGSGPVARARSRRATAGRRARARDPGVPRRRRGPARLRAQLRGGRAARCVAPPRCDRSDPRLLARTRRARIW